MNGTVTRRPLRSFLALLVPCALSVTCGQRGGENLGPSQPIAGAPASPASTPLPTPTPSPAATPAAPTPQEEPDPAPSPACIHDTAHGVDSVSLVIYFLECNGERIPGRPDMKNIPLGCRIHFNATPRDGMNAPTCSKSWPVWQVGPEDLVSGSGADTFTPAYSTKAPGVMSARCLVDGVRSGWIVLNIVDR
jgi:hypothetical protein